MVKRRVPTRIPAGGKFVTVDDEATKGAVVGLDLYWPDGSVVTEAELRNMVSNGGGPTLPAGVGSWDELWRIVNSRGGGIPDAPSDGSRYGRQDGAWEVDPIQDDAPSDDEWYERRNGAWERGTTVFVQDDEPMDARRGDTWVQTFPLPSAATGLTATADGSDAIDIAWTDTNGGEAYYKVRRSLDGSTGWVVLATTAAGGESYRDESVSAATEYYYDVIAVDANGESAASNVDSATPSAPPNGLLNGLAHYYKFDEASGTRVDSHGSLDLTDFDTVGAAAGIINNGALFVRANTEQLYAAAGPGAYQDITVNLWLKPTDLQTGIVMGYLQGGSMQVSVEISAAGTVTFQVSTRASVTSTDTVSSGTEHRIHCHYDGSTGGVSLTIDDGTPATNTGNPGTNIPGASFLVFGSGSGAGNGINSVVDECGIWFDTIHTSDQIEALYNDGNALPFEDFTA